MFRFLMPRPQPIAGTAVAVASTSGAVASTRLPRAPGNAVIFCVCQCALCALSNLYNRILVQGTKRCRRDIFFSALCSDRPYFVRNVR